MITMFMYIIIYKDMKFLINNSILLRRFKVDVLKWKLLNNTRVMMKELNTNHNNHNDNISCWVMCDAQKVKLNFENILLSSFIILENEKY